MSPDLYHYGCESQGGLSQPPPLFQIRLDENDHFYYPMCLFVDYAAFVNIHLGNLCPQPLLHLARPAGVQQLSQMFCRRDRYAHPPTDRELVR